MLKPLAPSDAAPSHCLVQPVSKWSAAVGMGCLGILGDLSLAIDMRRNLPYADASSGRVFHTIAGCDGGLLSETAHWMKFARSRRCGGGAHRQGTRALQRSPGRGYAVQQRRVEKACCTDGPIHSQAALTIGAPAGQAS